MLVVLVKSKEVSLAPQEFSSSFDPRVFCFDVGQVPVRFRSQECIDLEVAQLINEVTAFGFIFGDGKASHIAKCKSHVVVWFG